MSITFDRKKLVYYGLFDRHIVVILPSLRFFEKTKVDFHIRRAFILNVDFLLGYLVSKILKPSVQACFSKLYNPLNKSKKIVHQFKKKRSNVKKYLLKFKKLISFCLDLHKQNFFII